MPEMAKDEDVDRTVVCARVRNWNSRSCEVEVGI